MYTELIFNSNTEEMDKLKLLVLMSNYLCFLLFTFLPTDTAF